MAEYDAGTAALSIFPSFKGVATAINKEAQKWGLTSSKSYADAFNKDVKNETAKTQVGPDKATSAKAGDSAAGGFADGFKKRVQAALKTLPDAKITADSSDVDKHIAAIKGQLETLRDATLNVDIDDRSAVAEINRLSAELARLANESPSISVRADVAAAQAELDKIAAVADKVADKSPTIGVDADTAKADAQLAATKAAAADLGRSSPTITPNVDAAPALAGIGGIQSALFALSAGGLIAPLALGVAALGGPLTAAAVGFVGMAAVAIPAASNIKKALDAQGKAADQAAKSQKALTTANEQVASAQSSLGDAQRSANQQAVSSAEQVGKAQQGLADAEKQAAQQRIAAEHSVQDAVRTGSQQITAARQSLAQAETQAASQSATAIAQEKAAEQSLAQAQVAAKNAQQALTDARKAAADQLKQLAFQTADASLAERGGKLAVEQAKAQLDAANQTAAVAAQQLATVQKTKGATKDQNAASKANADAGTFAQQQAQLAYDQAVQSLKEQSYQTKQLAATKSDADKKGIKGSDQVIAAQQNITQANQTVKDQQTALAAAQANVTKTQLAGQQSVLAAQQKLTQVQQDSARTVARAQANLVQTEVSGAEQVANAQQSIADAVRAQSNQQVNSAAAVGRASTALDKALAAQKKAHDGATTAAKLSRAALDKLSPSEKKAAGAFESFKGGFKDWAKDLEPDVLPAFTGALGLLHGALSPLSGAISGTSGAIVDLEKKAGKAFKSPFWKSFSKFLGKESGTAVTDLGTAFGNIASGLAGMFQGLAPLGNDILGVLDDVTGDFSNWGQNLAKHGPGKTMQSIIDLGNALWGLFKKLAPLISPLIQVIETGLTFAVKGLSFVFTPLITFMDQHKTVFKIVAGGLLAAAAAMVILNFAMDANPIGLVILAIAALASGIIALVNNWGTVKRGIIDAANAVWGFLKQWGPTILVAIAPVIGVPLLIWQHWKLIKHYIVKAFDGAVGWLVDAGKSILTGLWHGLKWLWDNTINNKFLVHLNGMFNNFFNGSGNWLVGAGKSVLTGLWHGIKWLWDNTINNKFLAHMNGKIGAFFKGSGTWLVQHGKDIMNGLGNGIKSAASKIESWLTTPLNAVIGLVNKFIDLINKIPGVDISHIGKLGVTKKPPKDSGGGTGGLGHTRALAHGGVLPGYAPGHDTVPVMASPGEGWLVPEAVQGLGANFVHWANDHFSNRGGRSSGPGADGVQRFLFGGIVKDVGKFGSWAGGKAKGAAEAVNPLHIVNKVFDAAVGAAFSTINAAAGSIPTDLGKQIGHGIVGAVRNSILHDGHADTKKAIADGSGGGGSFLSYAQQFKGQPYVWGGSEPGGFDCSGLTSYVMNHFGLHSPRTASQQEAWASPLSKTAALPGDLIFYGGAVGKGGAHHVAFNEGNGKMFEAQQTGTPLGDYPIRSGGIYGRAPGASKFLGGSLGALFGGVGSASGSLGKAIATVLSLLHQPQSLAGAVASLIQHESGGNDTAVNKTDINWRNGTPSVGDAQVIAPTFRRYAGKFLNTGPFLYGVSTNKVANIFAAMNYGIDQYGSISQIPGIASLASGGGYRPYDSGGPLPPGITLAYNGTGKTEHVFTADQLRALGEGRGGRGPMGNVYVDTMVVSDRTDADLAARKLAYSLTTAGMAS